MYFEVLRGMLATEGHVGVQPLPVVLMHASVGNWPYAHVTLLSTRRCNAWLQIMTDYISLPHLLLLCLLRRRRCKELQITHRTGGTLRSLRTLQVLQKVAILQLTINVKDFRCRCC